MVVHISAKTTSQDSLTALSRSPGGRKEGDIKIDAGGPILQRPSSIFSYASTPRYEVCTYIHSYII